MAEFLPGRQTKVAGIEPGAVWVGGQEASFVFGNGTQIFPNLPVPIWGSLAARVVADAGERWFEIGFRMDHELSGNAAAGWTDAGDYLRVDAEWSPDLVNWSAGKFVPAPVPVTDLGGGMWEYWSRALNPQDSASKTGQLLCDQVNGDARNNGFTSLMISGVAQALNFPYDMTVAGTAARLQSDLIALGWTGTVVTGTTAENWRVFIPDVNYTSYAQTSYIGFPGYYVADIFGNMTNLINKSHFGGSFVDAAGTVIHPKAFGRLKFSAGSRYNPYL